MAVALAIGGRSAGYLVQAIVLLDSQLSVRFVLSAAVPPRASCVKRSGAPASSFSFPLLQSAAAASFCSLAAGAPRASFVKRGGLSAAMLILFHASSAAATAFLSQVAFSLHSRCILVAFVLAWLLKGRSVSVQKFLCHCSIFVPTLLHPFAKKGGTVVPPSDFQSVNDLSPHQHGISVTFLSRAWVRACVRVNFNHAKPVPRQRLTAPSTLRGNATCCNMMPTPIPTLRDA